MAWNSLKWLLPVAALVFGAPAEAAKLYKWVDERGNVTYLDRPPPAAEGRVEEKNFRERRGSGGSDPAAAEAAGKAPVTLYATPECSSCDSARAHLKRRKVPFTDVDVSPKNPQAQEEMRNKVGQLSVPTITVGGKVMRGYIDSLLDGELDQAGYPKVRKAGAAEENAESEGGLAPTR
jgi:glutaredoxin